MLCVSFSCATCVARPSAPRPAGALASCWRSQRIYPAPGRREIAGPGSEGRSRTILGGCQGACPLIGAGVGRGGSRARRRLRSSGAQRISRSLGLSPLSFFFELRSETTWPDWSGPPSASSLSATSFSLLIRAGCPPSPSFHLQPKRIRVDRDRNPAPSLSSRLSFRAALIRSGRLERSLLPFHSPRYLFCVSSVAPSNAWPDWSRDLSPPLSALHLFTFRVHPQTFCPTGAEFSPHPFVGYLFRV